MTTPRNRAIYRAKQAFALMWTNGRPGGLIRFHTDDGVRWFFRDSESGYIVILKHATDYRDRGGAVDATRTRDTNMARVREEKRAARLVAAPAEEPKPAPAEDAKTEERGPVDPTAEHIAQDMTRRAVAAALQEEDGTARRAYTTDSGLLMVRASFDGDSVVVSWAVDGRPLSRAAAESLIAARVARVSAI